MSRNRLELNTAEFLRELRNLPDELAGDAGVIVSNAANEAAATIRSVYDQHRVTGNLSAGVRVIPASIGRFGVNFIVKSMAKHAWLFDNGSQARHWASGKSTGQMWGNTAPTHVFVRTMIAARRRMYDRLGDLLRRKGLNVTGKAA
jgi:hypothetical protein